MTDKTAAFTADIMRAAMSLDPSGVPADYDACAWEDIRRAEPGHYQLTSMEPCVRCGSSVALYDEAGHSICLPGIVHT